MKRAMKQLPGNHHGENGQRALRCFLLVALCFSSATSALSAVTNIAPARVQEIAAWLTPKPAGLGQPAARRAVWEKLAGQGGFASVVKDADSLAKQSVPALPDELFL